MLADGHAMCIQSLDPMLEALGTERIVTQDSGQWGPQENNQLEPASGTPLIHSMQRPLTWYGSWPFWNA